MFDQTMSNHFQTNGFELIDNFLQMDELLAFQTQLNTMHFSKCRGGIRNADKKFPSLGQLTKSDKLLELVRRYLRNAPTLVRAIIFDKNQTNNWLVNWHQDKTIAVSHKVDIPGWGPWSVKDGVHHVQPPTEVLGSMVTLRLHLDDCGIHNGCLRILPGSHHLGILSNNELIHQTHNLPAHHCEASAGSALVMKPLLVHSSGKASQVSRRRVIHLEYSDYQLPSGLKWK